jgi:hypothetical protein
MFKIEAQFFKPFKGNHSLRGWLPRRQSFWHKLREGGFAIG